jgi:hypothetical protein
VVGVKRLIGLLAVIAVLVSVPFAPSALAATEIGSTCVANASEPGPTVVQLAKAPGDALPLVVPSAGVLTSWTVNAGPEPAGEPDPQKLEVFRSLTNPSKLQSIGESAEEQLANGTNTFKTRIPVLAGDRLGLYGPRAEGTVACNTGVAEDEIGLLRAATPLGSVNIFPPDPKFQVPVSASVEPDRDGDGYGDETQDACPQSAAYQAACPSVAVSATALARKRAIIVRVKVSSEALIDVYGQVGWGFEPSPKLKIAGAKPKPLIVALSGPKQTVLPGEPASFKVPLPKAVLHRLGRLAPKQALTAKLTVSSANLAGQAKKQRLNVKLAGRDADA